MYWTVAMAGAGDLSISLTVDDGLGSVDDDYVCVSLCGAWSDECGL